MMIGQRKIGVLMGGLSAERDVSIRTGEAVVAALSDRGHDAWPLFVDRDPASGLTVAEMYLEAVFPRYGRSRTEQALRKLAAGRVAGAEGCCEASVNAAAASFTIARSVVETRGPMTLTSTFASGGMTWRNNS